MEKNTKLLTEIQKMKTLMNYMEGKQVIKEEENVSSILHTLIGTEMSADKRANNSNGASHHVAAYEAAAKATRDFVEKHPEVMKVTFDYKGDEVESDFDRVTNHFLEKLYR